MGLPKNPQNLKKMATPPAQTVPAAAMDVPRSAPRPGSLHVAGLKPNVTESDLYNFFRRIGENCIASIRVCRDSQTGESLRYAYVNFHSEEDAKRALEALNYEEIDGRSCRISWTCRDPTVRKSGVGNLFVKNLDKRMDNVNLHEVFENFGDILSCKVSTDAATGESRGYGFVHFANPADAKKAMEGLNGKFINVGDEGEKGKQIFVGPFVSRNQRSGAGNRFTNVYLKHINPALSSERFDELVIKATEDIAKITSPWLATNTRTREDGTKVEESKGFGFVNFETHEGTLRALDRFHDMAKMRELAPELLHPKEDLYAAQAMNKSKRRNQLGQVPLNRNLYIKNLAESVTDKQLEELFAQFGEIVSTKIMVNEDTGVKRGFGFVCFKNADDARKAITHMTNYLLEGKPLYVALAQPKELRRKQLEAQFAQRMMAPYPYGPYPVQARPMVPAGTRMPRGAPVYTGRGGFPGMNMAQRGRPQGAFPHPPGGRPVEADNSIRGRLKSVPDDHKIQFLGDTLFSLPKGEDGTDTHHIVGTLLKTYTESSLEETVNRLVPLCEDPEKRAEAIQNLPLPSNK